MSKLFSSRVLAALASISSLFLFVQSVAAQTQTFVYTVKFACVPEVGPAVAVGAEAPFEPALYRTVINVHNPTRQRVQLTKRAILARSENLPRGAVSPRKTETLSADQALAVDCLDIQGSLFGGPQPVGDGFVVIESATDLDVVAVYTSLFVEDKTTDLTTETPPGDQLAHDVIAADKIIIKVDPRRPPVTEGEGRALDKLGLRPGAQVEVIARTSVGAAGSIVDAAKKVLVDQLEKALIDQGSPQGAARGRAIQLIDGLSTTVVDVEFGLGVGVGKGIGIGRGIGRGIGVGLSMDVEYIQPKIRRGGNVASQN